MSIQLRSYTVAQSWDQTVVVGAEAILEDTILWPDAEIASQTSVGGLYCPLPKKGQRRPSQHRHLIYENRPASSDERGSIFHDWMSPR